MNQLGNSLVLQDLAGNVTNSSQGQCLGVCIKSALAGSLTIAGVSNTDGSAASWVITPATVGYVAPPGSGNYWRGMDYTLSSAGDAGKAIVLWAPK